MKSQSFLKILTIAGSDSGAAAGIQADLKTFAALKCYGTSAITAVTAQNTQGITANMPLSTEIVVQQIEAILFDIGADAIKIGMLYSSSMIEAVQNILTKHPSVPVVLDPVMVSTTGCELLRSDALISLIRFLSLTTVVTPNLNEAERLTGISIANKTAMEAAAVSIINLGAPAVLVKGGHLSFTAGKGADCLAEKKPEGIRFSWIEAPPILSNDFHGLGCTYSAAIAVGLARSLSLEQAIKMSKKYIHGAIQESVIIKIGHGASPLHHFYE